MSERELEMRIMTYIGIKGDYKILNKYVESFERYEEALRELDNIGIVTEIDDEDKKFEVYFHGIFGIVDEFLGRPVLRRKFKLDVNYFLDKANLRKDIHGDRELTIDEIEKFIDIARGI